MNFRRLQCLLAYLHAVGSMRPAVMLNRDAAALRVHPVYVVVMLMSYISYCAVFDSWRNNTLQAVFRQAVDHLYEVTRSQWHGLHGLARRFRWA